MLYLFFLVLQFSTQMNIAQMTKAKTTRIVRTGSGDGSGLVGAKEQSMEPPEVCT